jgi:hypothetical protein
MDTSSEAFALGVWGVGRLGSLGAMCGSVGLAYGRASRIEQRVSPKRSTDRRAPADLRDCVPGGALGAAIICFRAWPAQYRVGFGLDRVAGRPRIGLAVHGRGEVATPPVGELDPTNLGTGSGLLPPRMIQD